MRLLMQDVFLLLAFEERFDLRLILSLSLQNFSVPSLFELSNQLLGLLIEFFALFVELFEVVIGNLDWRRRQISNFTRHMPLVSLGHFYLDALADQ